MLEVLDLKKNYFELRAVQGVSFSLKPGDIFGFIGSNGAGKTTTIKMLATLLEPSEGTATIDGYDIQKDQFEVRRRIGYMPDFFGVYDDVKVSEYLQFFAALYQIPKNSRDQIIDNVLELTDLTPKREQYVQSLSRGMQQRLCLARCLVHDPSLLLLDEPASGLDPRARIELRELILELGRMGKIIIVSSHILPELSDFCNVVGVIDRGKMVATGPVENVLRSIRPTRHILIKTLGAVDKGVLEVRRQQGVVEAASCDEHTIKVEFQGDDQLAAEMLKRLVMADVPICDFREDVANLEDAFIQLTTGGIN